MTGPAGGGRVSLRRPGSASGGPPGRFEHRRLSEVDLAAVRQQGGGGQGDHHARDDVDRDRLQPNVGSIQVASSGAGPPAISEAAW